MKKLNHDHVTQIASLELKLHPQLEPVDMYKLLYQALYGPFHIVKDIKQLCISIDLELWQIESSYKPDFQELGPLYSRLSLSLIKQDKNPTMRQRRITSMAEWILDSCDIIGDVRDDFRRQWLDYREIFQQLLPASTEAWLKADRLVEDGLLPSHSETFHKHYQPHYRLINHNLTKHKEIFLELNT
jgi:hypothetical protein